MTLNTWSTTAASNATADATINYAEGQAPSSVNDSARALMAAVAKYRNDQAGTLTTGGSSTAYTLTSNQVFASLSAMNGMSLRIKFNATNGAAPTLNVDGLGAKAIVNAVGTAIGAGDIIASTVRDVVYDNANSVFVVVGGAPAFPVGTVMLFQQTAAPTGWTKSVTHNDKALRVVSGAASSGGSNAFSTVMAQTTVGSTTLAASQIPGHTHSGTTANQNTDHAHSYEVFADNGQSTGSLNPGATNFQIAGGNSPTTTGFNNANHAHTFTTDAGTGGGLGHNHTITLGIQYVDVIAATKD